MILNEETKPILSLMMKRIYEHPENTAVQHEIIQHTASLLTCTEKELVNYLDATSKTNHIAQQHVEHAWSVFLNEVPKAFQPFTPLFIHKKQLITETLSHPSFQQQYQDKRSDEIEWIRELFTLVVSSHEDWHTMQNGQPFRCYETHPTQFQNEELQVVLPCNIRPLTHQIYPAPILRLRCELSVQNLAIWHQIPPALTKIIRIQDTAVYIEQPDDQKHVSSSSFYWFDTSQIEPEPQGCYFELEAYEKDGDRYYSLAKSLSLEKLLTTGKFYTQTMIRNDKLHHKDTNEPIDWLLLSYHKPGSSETLGYFSTKIPSQFVIAT